jgi:hypothetical protein
MEVEQRLGQRIVLEALRAEQRVEQRGVAPALGEGVERVSLAPDDALELVVYSVV